jgi:hypothetical protein
MPYSAIKRFPIGTSGTLYGAIFDVRNRPLPALSHAANSNVYVKMTLTSNIGPQTTTIPVQSVQGAPNQGTLKFNFPTGDTCQYTAVQQSPPAFLNCVRGPAFPHSYPANTPIFFWKTTVGVVPARLIVENAFLRTISTKAILTMLQREQSLVDRTDCPGVVYDRAMGYDVTSEYDFISQLYHGTRRMRDHYDATGTVPFYFDGVVDRPKRTYYDNSTSSLKDVKLRVNNAATHSLFRYNQFVKVFSDGGGNLNYFRIWLDFGF